MGQAKRILALRRADIGGSPEYREADLATKGDVIEIGPRGGKIVGHRVKDGKLVAVYQGGEDDPMHGVPRTDRRHLTGWTAPGIGGATVNQQGYGHKYEIETRLGEYPSGPGYEAHHVSPEGVRTHLGTFKDSERAKRETLNHYIGLHATGKIGTAELKRGPSAGPEAPAAKLSAQTAERTGGEPPASARPSVGDIVTVQGKRATVLSTSGGVRVKFEGGGERYWMDKDVPPMTPAGERDEKSVAADRKDTAGWAARHAAHERKTDAEAKRMADQERGSVRRRVTEDDASLYGSQFLGHEGEMHTFAGEGRPAQPAPASGAKVVSLAERRPAEPETAPAPPPAAAKLESQTAERAEAAGRPFDLGTGHPAEPNPASPKGGARFVTPNSGPLSTGGYAGGKYLAGPRGGVQWFKTKDDAAAAAREHGGYAGRHNVEDKWFVSDKPGGMAPPVPQRAPLAAVAKPEAPKPAEPPKPAASSRPATVIYTDGDRISSIHSTPIPPKPAAPAPSRKPEVSQTLARQIAERKPTLELGHQQTDLAGPPSRKTYVSAEIQRAADDVEKRIGAHEKLSAKTGEWSSREALNRYINEAKRGIVELRGLMRRAESEGAHGGNLGTRLLTLQTNLRHAEQHLEDARFRTAKPASESLPLFSGQPKPNRVKPPGGQGDLFGKAGGSNPRQGSLF